MSLPFTPCCAAFLPDFDFSNTLLGNETCDKEVVDILNRCGIPYRKANDIADVVATELAKGKIIGWVQGRMEAGPRALGQRSILADPRCVDVRDRVNRIIKFREYWRPFCPSLPAESASIYLKEYVDAPFMTIAFEATEKMAKEAPAVVHTDGTVRVQLVHREVNPLFHRLLHAFKDKTGIPILLNTSFNIKGEPMVSTIYDALRVFYASGLDLLVCGNYLVYKSVA